MSKDNDENKQNSGEKKNAFKLRLKEKRTWKKLNKRQEFQELNKHMYMEHFVMCMADVFVFYQFSYVCALLDHIRLGRCRRFTRAIFSFYFDLFL